MIINCLSCHAQMKRCTRRHRCRTCARDHYCMNCPDCPTSLCTKERSARPTRSGLQWWHLAHAPRIITSRPPATRAAESCPRAPIEQRNHVYNKLLRACGLSLSVTRRVGLRARGLSNAAIDAGLYVDTPTPVQGDEIAVMLASDDLRGVPGFYQQGDRACMVRCRPGFFVPYRDEHGCIQAMQYRLDEPCAKRKYVWLSSNPELTDDAGRQLYPFGTSSGAPVHHAYHYLLAAADELIVTEGALKADVIAYFTQAPVVGIAGVSNFGRDFATHLKSCAPSLRRIFVAYDRDLIEKREVRHAFKGLCELLLVLMPCPAITRIIGATGFGLRSMNISSCRC